MALLTLLLAAIAMPIAAAICFGVQALARSFGFRPRAERVSTADEYWLSQQNVTLER